MVQSIRQKGYQEVTTLNIDFHDWVTVSKWKLTVHPPCLFFLLQCFLLLLEDRTGFQASESRIYSRLQN